MNWLFKNWLFKIADRIVTKRERKELEDFLSALKSMTNPELAELVVFATHARHGLEQRDNNVLDPLSLWLKKPGILTEMIRHIENFKSNKNHNAAASLMVWAHSIRAVSRGELLPLGQEMWQQMSRGFDDLAAAKESIHKRFGTNVDIADATKIPVGLG